MHVRLSSVTRRGKTYCYGQLVESFRRPADGMPAHRVVANLGRLDPQAVKNLQTALSASRRGQAVVVPEAAACRLPGQPVQANLRYLDVAVLLRLWGQWNLPTLLAEALGAKEAEVGAEAVVAALVIQRCVAPGSKLLACRWLPTSALPELLAMSPGRFNNTRLHRVLDRLAEADPAVQAGIARRVHRREGALASLFLDVTDTWFVGRGPDVAEPAKTKEGLYRRKIGIVALCDERGYPLRWQVVSGRCHDSVAMTELLESAAGVEWTEGTPIIFDRAMGKTAHIERVLATGLHFITAVTLDEFDTYGGGRLPVEQFAAVGPAPDSEARQRALKRLGDAAEAAGMQRVGDDLFVVDLGLIESHRQSPGCAAAPLPSVVAGRPTGAEPTSEALRLAQTMRGELEAGQATSLRDVGLRHGLSKWQARDLLRLTRLPTDVQQAIAQGRARGVSPGVLAKLERLEGPERQREAFEERIAQAAARGYRPGRSGGRMPPSGHAEPTGTPWSVRVVAGFNPDLLLALRQDADEKLARVHEHVREVNDKLRSPRSRQTRESAYAAVERHLRRHDLLDAFDVKVVEGAGGQNGAGRGLQVQARLEPDAWARRRRYDGFFLLVVHPDVSPSRYDAAQVARLYRAKDVLEKDFHIIKSVVAIRPVRHHTDPKVRAHVALCMLALLLCRTLERELARANLPSSAAAAIETLATCHLNQILPEGADAPYYSVTRPTREQAAILDALHLQDLVDDQAVAQAIQPR